MSWRAFALVVLFAVEFINVGRASTPYTAGNSFQAEPFTGQGGYNANGPPDVYVSAMLERLLVVDDKHYRFESVTYVHLSWRDPNAKAAITEATERFRNSSTAECKRPCTSDWTLSKRKDQSLDDSRVLCCDEPLWLPTIPMMNVYSLPDTRLQPYQIVTDEGGGVSWAITINGEFFSPMNVKYFPFDSQALQIQFAHVNADYIRKFVPSAGSTSFGQRGEGDVVSGWNVETTEVVVGNTTVLKAFGDFSCCKGEVGFPALDDPAPIDSTTDGSTELVSFDIVVSITRLSSFYSLTMLAPMLILVVLSLFVFVIPPERLDARLALAVTLFLSLTAMQFTLNDFLPHSSYPTSISKLVLVFYCVVALDVPESILACHLGGRKAVVMDTVTLVAAVVTLIISVSVILAGK